MVQILSASWAAERPHHLALGTWHCEPSKPQNYGKTQHFAQILPTKISLVSHLRGKTSLLSNIDAATTFNIVGSWTSKLPLINHLALDRMGRAHCNLTGSEVDWPWHLDVWTRIWVPDQGIDSMGAACAFDGQWEVPNQAARTKTRTNKWRNEESCKITRRQWHAICNKYIKNKHANTPNTSSAAPWLRLDVLEDLQQTFFNPHCILLISIARSARCEDVLFKAFWMQCGSDSRRQNVWFAGTTWSQLKAGLRCRCEAQVRFSCFSNFFFNDCKSPNHATPPLFVWGETSK